MSLRTDELSYAIDQPGEGATVSRTAFLLTGWVYAHEPSHIESIAVICNDMLLGETRALFPRPDVAAALNLAAGTPCGFRIFVECPDTVAEQLVFDIVARVNNDEILLERRRVELSKFDERLEPHGLLGDRKFLQVLERKDIYGVGPPSEEASTECVEIVLSETRPGDHVLDLGCGIGPYAGPLIHNGRSWVGCEVEPAYVETMRARGLDARLVSETGIPFDAGSFDISMAIEVLEHIPAYDAFVAEMARVARRAALISVPNAGAIPRLAPLGLVPWHILESTHVNFFTTGSLRALLMRHFPSVEVFEYGRLPVSAADGTPVFNHIFAVALHAVV